ncbi:Hypothetical predicted protein [Mytilus galloprovincialis]|uniref:B box-type domain-containing protein n=1 Tax=Mytilus galloprovincialis TaxID=29158 RepID=A0A8B6EK59_MYTGA|nr:Hypothetical predicted protein [Mytilus galloprovincialis]
MASAGQQDFLKRLQQFYGDVVMNVVHVYFEREVLDKTTFFFFLDKNKHELFHELIPQIFCCECLKSNSIASVSKTGCLDAFQFDLLYDRSACAETNHEIKRGQKFQQHCICNINPNRVEVADLDIILIRAVIKTCCKRTLPGNPSWLKEIKDVRNYIYHTGSSSRISKSDFEEKWSLLEKNTLNIAMMTGKSFQYMTQKEIQRLKAEHDTTDRTHMLAEKENNCLKEEILNVLKNQPGVKQDEIGHISYQLDQILFKIADLGVQISTKRKADVIESEQKEESTKCYVRWTLSTPSSWCVEDIKRKLRSVAELTNFTIEFVYTGSLIIDTSVSLDLITVPDRLSIAFLEFLHSFVKSCEIDTTIAVNVDVKVLVSFEPYMEITEEFTFGPCRTCSNRNLRTGAEKWCKDCQELYCNTCSMYHMATTPLAYHTILSLNDSMEYFPPKFPQNITSCNKHDRDFNFFCKTHHQIICVECVRLDHTNCNDIVTLNFAAISTTSSIIFKNLVSNAQELIYKVNQVLSDLGNTSSNIELENTRMKTAITDAFKGIPTANEVMKTMLNDLNLKYEKCIYETEKNVTKIEKIRLDISEINIQIHQVKEYCSERKAFVFMHNVVKGIMKADKTFRTSLSDMKIVSLHCESGELVYIQGYKIEKLKIVLNSEPYMFQSEKNKQAQVPISIDSINQIMLSNVSYFPVKDRRISACFVCVLGKLIISNTTRTGLLLYNIKSGSFEQEIGILLGKTYANRLTYDSDFFIKDITIINENCVAVLRMNDIVSVNVKTKRIDHIKKSLPFPCFRLSCCDELLYLLTSDINITVLDMNGCLVKTINFQTDVQGIISFVVHTNKILCLSKVASCFNLNGELLWKNNVSIGRPDDGVQIAVDNWGNCYIPSDVDKNIIIISNNGNNENAYFQSHNI